MKVPQPEKRKCDECLNYMTLNLFRLNSEKCRYCQESLAIPERLKENQPKLNHDSNTSTLQTKDIDTYELKDNYSFNQENMPEEYVSDQN